MPNAMPSHRPARSARGRHRAHSPGQLGQQWAELCTAVPQVVGQRLARMAVAGPSPSASDRKEFQRMGAEKLQAFQESWAGMGAEVWYQQQQSFWLAWQRSWTWPLSLCILGRQAGSMPAIAAWPGAATQAAAQVLGRGLAPLHRRATANARRLGRPGRR